MTDASESRYRDWDNLRYWFRGVERFAPWVNRVHFLTWGHVPEWLNVHNPWLNIVRHKDFIPAEYLPVFSSHPIELSMHRIEGLAERFVYFNDDTFLTRPVGPERFFRRGLPCDNARLSIIPPGGISHIVLNDVELINRRHDKNSVMRRHVFKWFNRRYTLPDMLKTLTLMPWSTFAGFRDSHMPQPYLLRTLEQVWAEEGERLSVTMRSRFRNVLDYNQYLMRYEQLVTGRFAPVSMCDCRVETLAEDSIGRVCEVIRSQRQAMICLHDNDDIRDFEGVRGLLNASLEQILPEKSKYEL